VQSDKNNNAISGLKNILGKLKVLGGNDSDSQMNQAEEMKRKSEAYHFDPNQSFPPEVVKNLKDVLKFHDDVMRGIIKKMEMVPGLTDLLDGLSNALNACE
jgi:ribosomal protein S6